jgi:hypothetical protein
VTHKEWRRTPQFPLSYAPHPLSHAIQPQHHPKIEFAREVQEEREEQEETAKGWSADSWHQLGIKTPLHYVHLASGSLQFVTIRPIEWRYSSKCKVINRDSQT